MAGERGCWGCCGLGRKGGEPRSKEEQATGQRIGGSTVLLGVGAMAAIDVDLGLWLAGQDGGCGGRRCGWLGENL